MKAEDRMSAEQLARRIEWVLGDQPGLAEDDHLVPEAAQQALEELVAEYPSLTEWCALAELAATARAVFEVSKSVEVPRILENRLGQASAESMTPLSNFHPPGDNASKVIRSFAALKHLASQRPPGYDS